MIDCRSTSPEMPEPFEKQRCTKPRGHKSRWHAAPGIRRWEGGIKTPAKWETPADDGYRSEGELAAMRQSGVRW